jgi:epoxyqueuosine reductase
MTIEARGEVPVELREKVGSLIYGCDICQDVCPWNHRFSREAKVAEFEPRAALSSNDARTIAREILSMDDAEFRSAFRKSAMKRAKLRGLKRNAAVALGNIGDVLDVDVLSRAVDDAEPLIREHAAWALDSIRARTADQLL